MNKHGRKMAAPIIIVCLFVLYYIGLFLLFVFIDAIPLWLKIILGVVPLGVAGLLIYVLVERIKEIRSGEEDDLSKY